MRKRKIFSKEFKLEALNIICIIWGQTTVWGLKPWSVPCSLHYCGLYEEIIQALDGAQTLPSSRI